MARAAAARRASARDAVRLDRSSAAGGRGMREPATDVWALRTLATATELAAVRDAAALGVPGAATGAAGAEAASSGRAREGSHGASSS